MQALRPLVLTAIATHLLLPAAAEGVKRRAFVTSITGTADLATWPTASGLTAHERADSICRAAAAAATPAPLPNAQSYRAWLSTASTDAYCHVQGLTGKRTTGCGGAVLPGAGPWYLANGITQLSPGLEQLVGPPFATYRPVSLDENLSEIVNGLVHTGTTPDGRVDDGYTCLDWSSESAASGVKGGLTHAAGGEWTSHVEGPCGQIAHLLCLEPGPSDESKLGWSQGALAFVSSALGTGDLGSWPQADGLSGVAAGDRICQNLAAAARLPAADTFVAWLTTPSEAAPGRLTTGGPFRRLDGFPLANSLADLVDGIAANSLHVDEHGAYLLLPTSVWTGTGANGQLIGGNCAQWTSAGSQIWGGAGFALRARNGEWTDAGDRACNLVAHLYCFANTITLFWDGFELTGDLDRWSTVSP